MTDEQLAKERSYREVWVAGAQGDIVSMRAMCDAQVTRWLRAAQLEDAELRAIVQGDAIALAELWARAMAEHEHAAMDDVYALVKVLTLASGDDFAKEDYSYSAEALGILSELADAGYEDCSIMANELASKIPPEAVAKAKSLGKYWQPGKTEETA